MKQSVNQSICATLVTNK